MRWLVFFIIFIIGGKGHYEMFLGINYLEKWNLIPLQLSAEEYRLLPKTYTTRGPGKHSS